MSKAEEVSDPKMKGGDKKPAFETDPITLVRRQKQIDYGYATQGYENYINAVPRWRRQRIHPKTPDKTQKCSRRSFDGQIRVWRLLLHAYDDAPSKQNSSASEQEVAPGNKEGDTIPSVENQSPST